MSSTIFLQYSYNTKNVISYSIQIPSTQSFVGTSVNESVDFAPLYDSSNNSVGTIQFNNINRQTVTLNPLYTVTENICIQLDKNTAIFFSDYYKSTSEYYENNSKIIIPIISCTGKYVGKKGYVVIDVVNDTRFIYIKLDD
jgi:hypothetical protein